MIKKKGGQHATGNQGGFALPNPLPPRKRKRWEVRREKKKKGISVLRRWGERSF